MKILKIALLFAGVALVTFGIYNVFVPQEAIEIGSMELSKIEDSSGQAFGMIGIGVLALLAGVLIQNRR